jgi:hypothetical protein
MPSPSGGTSNQAFLVRARKAHPHAERASGPFRKVMLPTEAAQKRLMREMLALL